MNLPQPLAIISDIHSNPEALGAVLADIDRRKIGTIWCLGDIVGYNSDPVPCVRQIRKRCEITLLGNHDAATFLGPVDFNTMAESALLSNLDDLQAADQVAGNEAPLLPFLAGLPHSHVCGDSIFVHCSPRDPVGEYLFAGDQQEAFEKYYGVFDFIERYCYCGHTHFPGMILQDDDGELQFRMAKGNMTMELPASGKAVVCVGSVGQPRDDDTRAAYVEVNAGRVHFHRIRYNFPKSALKNFLRPGIPIRCGTRLLLGR